MAGASGEVLWIGLTQISVGIRGEMVSCKNQVEPRKQTSLFGGVAKWPKMLVHDINIRWFESNRLLSPCLFSLKRNMHVFIELAIVPSFWI